MHVRSISYRVVLPSVVAWVMAIHLAAHLASAQQLVRFAPGGKPSPEQPPSQVLEEPVPKPKFPPPPLAAPRSTTPAPSDNTLLYPDGGAYQEALACENCEQSAACYSCGANRRWFGSVSGLIMSRNHANSFISTVDALNANNALLNSDQASAGWTGGYQVQIGRRFSCNTAVEATYWSLAPMDGSASVSSAATPGPFDAAFDTANLTFNGVAAGDYFNNAHQQLLTRRDLTRNLEVNAWYNAPNYGGSRCQFSWLGGVRWFQFDERLIFGSLSGGGGAVPAANNFGDNGGASEAYLRINTNNNLVGFQLGGNFDFLWGPRLRFFSTPKFGVYGNHMSQSASIYTGNGINALASPPGGVAGTYPFNATKDDVAVLAQMDLGLKYQLTARWRVSAAYRIVAVSGVALGDHQVPADVSQYQLFQTIQSNGNLLLHGAVFGLEANF
jgi:hypothetical protein